MMSSWHNWEHWLQSYQSLPIADFCVKTFWKQVWLTSIFRDKISCDQMYKLGGIISTSSVISSITFFRSFSVFPTAKISLSWIKCSKNHRQTLKIVVTTYSEKTLRPTICISMKGFRRKLKLINVCVLYLWGAKLTTQFIVCQQQRQQLKHLPQFQKPKPQSWAETTSSKLEEMNVFFIKFFISFELDLSSKTIYKRGGQKTQQQLFLLLERTKPQR